MPLLPVDLAADGSARPDQVARLHASLAGVPDAAPVVIMLHGFRFSPNDPDCTPHRHILGRGDREAGDAVGRGLSWPQRLGLAGDDPARGLGIALGWEARGTLWSAWSSAACAGAGLARLVDDLAQAHPGRRFDVIAHSLGARVALTALRQAGSGAFRRLILLAAAEFGSAALAAADSPSGRRAGIVNVTGRENAVFDLGLELALAAGFGRSLGRGLPRPRGNWTDLALDDPALLARLRRMGHPVAPSGRRICHWSCYMRPGAFGLYRALIEGLAPPALPVPAPVGGRGRAGRDPAAEALPA